MNNILRIIDRFRITGRGIVYTVKHSKNTVIRINDIMKFLNEKVIAAAKVEGLLAERQPGSGTIKQLEAFMNKYGYSNGHGWWVKID